MIADHIRACSFLIVDGVIPGNEGRGYVLRRIIRRAIRHGYQLGQKQPFFHRLVADLDQAMGDAYPELRQAKERVAETLKAEEEQFAKTLENGMKLFAAGARTEERVIGYIRDHFVHDFQSYEPRNNTFCEGIFHKANEDVLVGAKSAGSVANVDTLVNKLVGEVENYSKQQGKPARMYLVLHGKSDKTPEELLDKVGRGRDYDNVRVLYLKESSIPFDGRTAFTLYDTYGFPFDLTQDLCREQGIPVDVSAYDTAMQEQRAKARAASKFAMDAGLEYAGGKTEFRGYEALNHPAKVVALYREGARADALKSGDTGTVVLDETPFYAEAGGQVGDRGELVGTSGHFRGRRYAEDPRRRPRAPGQAEDRHAESRRPGRGACEHRAARQHHAQPLGDPPHAQGAARGTRPARAAEGLAGRRGEDALRLLARQADDRAADPRSRVAGERRDPAECADARAGHADRAGQEIRRRDAVRREIRRRSPCPRDRQLARVLRRHARRAHRRHRRVQDHFRGRRGVRHPARRGDHRADGARHHQYPAAGVPARWQGSCARSPARAWSKKPSRRYWRRKEPSRRSLPARAPKLAMGQGSDLASQAVDVKGAKVLVATLDGADAKTLRETMDKLKDRLKSAAIVLSTVNDGKVALIAGVTADLTAKLKAGDLVNYVAQQVGGKGGGRADMAQAGGTDPAGLASALQSVKSWVEQRV